MQIDDSLDINIFSDLPARTGLGSSSAFTVGLLNALYALEIMSYFVLNIVKAADIEHRR